MDIPSLPPLPHPVVELVTLRTRGFTYYNTSICTCSCCCCCCYQGWDVATFLTGCWSVRRIACITCISEMQNAKTGFISSYVPALFFSLYYLCVSSIYLSAGLPRCPGSKVAATSQVNPSTDVMLCISFIFTFAIPTQTLPSPPAPLNLVLASPDPPHSTICNPRPQRQPFVTPPRSFFHSLRSGHATFCILYCCGPEPRPATCDLPLAIRDFCNCVDRHGTSARVRVCMQFRNGLAGCGLRPLCCRSFFFSLYLPVDP